MRFDVGARDEAQFVARIERQRNAGAALPLLQRAPDFAAAQSRLRLLYETHPDNDDGPVDWVEVVSIVDGRRDLSEMF
ncbi:hypothetical protein RA307_28725 [Xanthobacteraceae bacterium Astr-EGSB]|uniref:hypothetical protein n=1 Tax=Astrobacterium formosum TaxID=3069710 RepID=UPI0027B79233|nr:hypothetical protein [Xanthobacteraceae bacterium Astr-EGSB]